MFVYHWPKPVLSKLADIYTRQTLDDQDRMAAGVEAFNLRLSTDPQSLGESRTGGYRVAFLPLLRVYFHVDATARRVRVVDVTRFGY